MPTISMFYGIIIRMYRELGGKHKQPHIHAEYQNQEIVLNFEGEILDGEINYKKLKLILAWIEIHKDELKANWTLLSNGEKGYPIEPLR